VPDSARIFEAISAEFNELTSSLGWKPENVQLRNVQHLYCLVVCAEGPVEGQKNLRVVGRVRGRGHVLRDKTVILVDDGIATGATMRVALLTVK
ncbi:hypothetical protein RA989_21695, partial [Mycobacteroides abscessus subsp. massiliense]